MKKKLMLAVTGIIIFSGILFPYNCLGQNQKAVEKKYLTKLPSGRPENDGTLQKYRMIAIYTNRDLYGNFIGKTKVSGDYTRGLENGFVTWSNILISGSNNFSEPFPAGTKQEYMENIKYIPSPKMLDSEAFKNFPNNTVSVFAKNLIWDMMTIEGFAWNYSDSLRLNTTYVIPDIKGEFTMADIGTYSHTSIQICWTGISVVNNNLCEVLEYRALDNKIELKMHQIKTKGTEQYWGTTWIDVETRQIEKAEMYGGTIQEIEIPGFKDKMLVKTIRELFVDQIK